MAHDSQNLTVIAFAAKWGNRMKITNTSMHAVCVAVRWASMKGFPNKLSRWTPEQNDAMQDICEEVDRRHALREIASNLIN